MCIDEIPLCRTRSGRIPQCGSDDNPGMWKTAGENLERVDDAPALVGVEDFIKAIEEYERTLAPSEDASHFSAIDTYAVLCFGVVEDMVREIR